MDLLQPPTRTATAAGTLLAAAHGPGRIDRAADTTADRSAPCGGWRALDPCGSAVVDHDYGGDARGTILTGRPVWFETVDECTAIGGQGFEAHEARARALLAQVESAAVAHELWTGELASAAVDEDGHQAWADNVRFAGPSTDDITPAGGAVPLLDGLAILEDALGGLLGAGQKAVHMTRGTATLLARPAALYRSGDVLLTPLDTRVIADAGYPGTGPDGNPAGDGETWLYGSARPAVYLSDATVVPDRLDQALDRSTNVVTVAAGRYGVTTLPCGVLAVRVALTTPTLN